MTALHTFEEEPKRGTPARKEAETSAFIYSQFQAFFSLREREREKTKRRRICLLLLLLTQEVAGIPKEREREKKEASRHSFARRNRNRTCSQNYRALYSLLLPSDDALPASLSSTLLSFFRTKRLFVHLISSLR